MLSATDGARKRLLGPVEFAMSRSGLAAAVRQVVAIMPPICAGEGFDLGIGLWLTEPAAKTYAAELKSRGKSGGIITCALAHRATRIAYALIRDHASYDPARWS